jgi:hypothetical protein
MKTLRLFITAIAVSMLFLTANAQWRTDPASPGLVCDLSGTQSNIVSLGDEEGGAYVFWTDTRNNPGQTPKQIYGQHYNNEGYELWESGGRLVMSHYNGILYYKIVRKDDGKLVLGMITQSQAYPGGDTLRFQMLDEAGAPVWDDPLVVANAGTTPNFILYLSFIMIMPVNDDIYVNIGVIYYGGSNGNRFTRFDSNGNLTGSYDGVTTGNQNYVGATYWDRTYDGSGDYYLFYATGNGSGASLHCFRFNGYGSQIWGPVDVTAGTAGLSYQLGGISDINGISLIWQGSGTGETDLFSRRLTPGGAFAYGGNTVDICSANGTQSNFFLKRKDMYLYVTWADGRPGVDPGYYDIYAQKLDTTGYLYWSPNGIEIASFNTYGPYPKLEIMDDYSIIVNHQSTVAGFMAQKVAADGSLPWGPGAKQLATTTFNPFYENHTLFQSGDNTIAVWNQSASGGGADGVYITLADKVQYAALPEKESNDISIYPNPAKDYVEVRLPEGMKVVSAGLFNAAGQMVLNRNLNEAPANDPISFITADLPPGLYFFRVITASETLEKKLLIR